MLKSHTYNAPEHFESLFQVLSSSRFLKKEGLGGELPFFIHSFPVSKQALVNTHIQSLIKRLQSEGIDIFEVDKKMQEYLSKNADIADKLEFYLTDVCGDSEDGLEIPDDIKLKKGSRLYSFDKSYHSTRDLADLKERYN